ncbi:MAG TPA: hypothetical protein VJ142_02505 [Candidatus Nanoarchaeia archaeon]|nr:hypothetical protein [Candidatus Nanoarchaeia archaeon]
MVEHLEGKVGEEYCIPRTGIDYSHHIQKLDGFNLPPETRQKAINAIQSAISGAYDATQAVQRPLILREKLEDIVLPNETYSVPGYPEIRYDPDKCGEAFSRLDEAIRGIHKLNISHEDRQKILVLMQNAALEIRDTVQTANKPLMDKKRLEIVLKGSQNLIRNDLLKVLKLKNFFEQVDITSEHLFNNKG